MENMPEFEAKRVHETVISLLKWLDIGVEICFFNLD